MYVSIYVCMLSYVCCMCTPCVAYVLNELNMHDVWPPADGDLAKNKSQHTVCISSNRGKIFILEARFY